MKKVLILLSLVLTLSIITAYVGSTGVTPKAPTKQALVANQTPVPSTLTISAKFTDTTTVKAIKLANAGKDYPFTNYVVLGEFDVTSTDCTINGTKKILTVQAGGCTLNVKAKPNAIVAGKNSGGAVLFGGTAIPLIASGAGAPKITALKPYKLTSDINLNTLFLDIPINGVAINDQYTVTLPRDSDGKEIVTYLARGNSQQYCTETFENDGEIMYVNNPNFLFNPQWIMCSFAVRAMERKDLNSFTAVVKVKHNNTDMEYLYTYHTFKTLNYSVENTIFPDTQVNTKSTSSTLVGMPPMENTWSPGDNPDIINAPDNSSFVTFGTGFFDNFAINEEWSTCEGVKSGVYTKQRVDNYGCALVIDFIPSGEGDFTSTIKHEQSFKEDKTEKTVSVKGKGRTFGIIYPGDGSTDGSVSFPDTKVGEQSTSATIVDLPAMSQIYDNLSTAPTDAFVTFGAGFFENFTINKELSTCTTVKSNYERQTVGTTACQLVIYFMPKVAGESRSSIKFEHGPWTVKPEDYPAVIRNTDVKGTGI